MKPTQKALVVPAVFALAAAAACAGGAPRERDPAVARAEAVRQVQIERTILDAHTASPVAVEARLTLPAAAGATGLTPSERAQIDQFASEFIQMGRGNVVISVPANSGNSQTASILAQEAQRALFASGVDFAKIAGGGYQAQGQPNAPVVLSFSRYEARAVPCTPWSQIDPRKTADNGPSERFGCAQNANLAAMLADPGDLLGDRREGPRSAERAQVGTDKYRKGEVEQVSGTIASGGGQ